MVLERLPAHSLVCPHHTVFQTTSIYATQQPIQGNLSLSSVSNLWRYSAIKHWNSDLYSLTGWVLIAGMIDSPQSRNIEMELLIWISRFAVFYHNLMCVSLLSSLKLGFMKKFLQNYCVAFRSQYWGFFAFIRCVVESLVYATVDALWTPIKCW